MKNIINQIKKLINKKLINKILNQNDIVLKNSNIYDEIIVEKTINIDGTPVEIIKNIGRSSNLPENFNHRNYYTDDYEEKYLDNKYLVINGEKGEILFTGSRKCRAHINIDTLFFNASIHYANN